MKLFDRVTPMTKDRLMHLKIMLEKDRCHWFAKEIENKLAITLVVI